MTKVGFPIAVANAADEVKHVAKLVTTRSGGHGAVREACEHVLRLNGHPALAGIWEREQRMRQTDGQI
jgi:3-deoxy-D-manno-octulosonate 8-phosphate phosphatase (KDO 8-P phosphatase)